MSISIEPVPELDKKQLEDTVLDILYKFKYCSVTLEKCLLDLFCLYKLEPSRYLETNTKLTMEAVRDFGYLLVDYKFNQIPKCCAHRSICDWLTKEKSNMVSFNTPPPWFKIL